MIKGAIFDVDGTLLDSLGIWEEADVRYLERLGIHAEEGLGRILYPMTLKEASGYIKRHYPIQETTEEIAAGVLEIVGEFYEEEAPLKSGAAELLESLRRRGIPMTAATTGERPLVEAAFKRLGIRSYFGKIFTCTEAGAGKDQPDIYRLAAGYLGIKPQETLVFEDALYAVETAAKAGFVTVGIEEPYNASDKEEIKGLADIYLERLKPSAAFWEEINQISETKRREIHRDDKKNSTDHSRK